MSGFWTVKMKQMKRKDLEEASDESLDFSLSSPARKIRRLDAEMLPIVEQEAVNPLGFDQSLPEDQLMGSTQQSAAPMEATVPPLPSNEEMALVVYKPFNTPLLQPLKSPNLSFRVNTDLIPALKNRGLWWSQNPTVFITELEEEEAPKQENPAATNDCQAVIPWVPSQLPKTQGMEDTAMGDGLPEPMEAEEVGMEVEETNVASNEGQEMRVAVGMGGEGLLQWQQQQCMIPQLLQNTSTPITWSW